jgi:hypothetical protein
MSDVKRDASDPVRAAAESAPYQPVELRLNLMIDLSDRLEGREVMAAGIGPDETVALLLAEPGPLPERASLPAVLMGWHDPVRRAVGALLVRGGETMTISIDPLVGFYSEIQPLADGGFLICQARVARGSEPNVNRYDAAGVLVAQFRAGDGVAQMLVDGSGRLWVGYFDEGIFGDPMSASGLNRFDVFSGDLEWSNAMAPDTPMVYECWALNSGDEATWVYYDHLHNLLVRVDEDDSCRQWGTDSGGAEVVATDGSRVLLIPHARRDRPRDIEIWELGPERFERPRPVIIEPALPTASRRVFARGPVIFSIDGARVFRGDIRDVGDAPDAREFRVGSAARLFDGR